jgi:multiple sugar transport system permease protein
MFLNRHKTRAASFFYYAILTIITFIYLVPVLWVISTSLRIDAKLFDTGQWIPNPLTFEHYTRLFDLVPNFGQIFLNTLIVSVLSTSGNLISCSLAGYALARMRFPGRNIVFFILLATLMLPGHVTLIPVYNMFRSLGWINDLKALIVPAFFGNAFATFFFRQFFLSIPKDYENAAFVDGASRWTTFWRIILPMSKPALLSIGLLNLVGSWNGFFLPTIYLQTQDKWVLTQALRSMIGVYSSNWGEIMAGVVITSLPIVVIYFLLHKQFTEGVTLSGLKG